MKTLQIIILLISVSFCFTNCSNFKDETIKAEDIIKSINKNKDILLIQKTITGDLDFTKIKTAYAMSNQLIIVEIQPSITFIDCKFEGKVLGFNIVNNAGYCTNFKRNLTFMKCKFADSLNFRQTTIDQTANFSQSEFDKNVSFEGAVFNGSTNYFNETIFRSDARFTNATFNGNAIFIKAVFKQLALFSKIKFEKNASFSAINFYGYTDFSNCEAMSLFTANYSFFSDRTYFNDAIFHSTADFHNIETDTIIEFKNIIFYGNTKFEKSTFKYNTTFRNTIFAIAEPDFTEVKKGEKFVMDSCKITNNSYLKIN